MRKTVFSVAALAMLSSVNGVALANGGGVEQMEGSFPGVQQVNEDPGGEQGSTDRVEGQVILSPREEGVFQAHKGEKLSEVLTRWTSRVGYELVWQPSHSDGDLEIEGGIRFENSFVEASREFIELVNRQSPFDAQLHSNEVMRVFVSNKPY